MLGSSERTFRFAVLSCAFVFSLTLAMFVESRPRPARYVERDLQFLNHSPSESFLDYG
jgi:hypothetical protein